MKYLPFVSDDTIVVYPDVYYGNILKAKNVVHWFLYYNRFAGEPNAVGKDDLIYSYREKYWDPQINPSKRMLFFSTFNFDLYKRTNYGERKGKCYIIRKGKNRSDLPKNFDGVIIDNFSEREKVRVFNECEFCIDYDLQTAYTSIAALCGCIPISIPEPGKKREDYRGIDDLDYFTAWSEDAKEIEKVRKLVDNAEEVLRDASIGMSKRIAMFVEDCRKHFNIKE